jgi:hypothetical protein
MYTKRKKYSCCPFLCMITSRERISRTYPCSLRGFENHT